MQALNELVGSLHTIDTRFICCLRFLNLHVSLSNLQVFQHLVTKALLLRLDHLFRLHSEVSLHLLRDLIHTLTTLLLDKFDHASHD